MYKTQGAIKFNEAEVSGVKFTILDKFSYREFMTHVGQIGFRVCVVNARALYSAQHDKSYKELLNSASIVVSDGVPIYKILKWRGYRDLMRKRGIDLFFDFLSDRDIAEKKHLFLGTNIETLRKVREALKAGGLLPEQAMFEPLPYGDTETVLSELDLTKIQNFAPDVVWVSLGAPKQDVIGRYLHQQIGFATVAGVGLVFDYVAGNVRKPPEFVSRMGFEWLFRIFTQTKRTVFFIKPFFFILGELIQAGVKNLVGKKGER
tara:strand:- start:19732 stop:20517 length:786 start_codon:yes stop_codon:yes gene_type:complete